ncbi:hypothetical protein E9531_04505 [Lampropedia puyangensis]|uniref:Uncharacterized protein n=1 Tax=Lampropedia puyangensis TaxID=1330072 RepID=A0A4S8F8P9_9BURK|nr:hypothetical protein [Lampropedia puyangensis]THU03993.1 hypothetical protein E9531_04505 [Lampropedia puyangensis]
MLQNPLQPADSSLELIQAWLPLLPADQIEVLLNNYESDRVNFAALPDEDKEQANPDKALVLGAAKAALERIMDAWEVIKATRKKLLMTLVQTKLEGTEPEAWQASLQLAVRNAFANIVWDAAATKPIVRSLSKDKNDFIQTAQSLKADPLDNKAIVLELSGWASTAEGQQGQRTTIEAALRTLGHFTSKPTHTQAQSVGIVLSPTERSLGPYLTAGMLLEHGELLWLDQTVNDNTGRTGFCMDTLNAPLSADEEPTAKLVREVAADMYATGHETGTAFIDSRLPQTLLPLAQDGYISITPLHSMGLSAYLHSHWQPWLTVLEGNDAVRVRQSFGEDVRYGFSTTAINNFTALRKVDKAYEQDPKYSELGNLPNRAILFNAPTLDVAHSTLARILHKGFAVRLPKGWGTRLMACYVSAAQDDASVRVLGNTALKAIERERSFYLELLPLLAETLEQTRGQCAEALADSTPDRLKVVLQDIDKQPTLTHYLLAGASGDIAITAPPLRRVASILALQLYAAVERIKVRGKDKEDMRIGLSIADKRRFMRWAPAAIARAIVHRGISQEV